MSGHDDDDECGECPAGLPAWLATFADLMSLLMCFFVLLLSFSEMDVLKYKQVAGSMTAAFGVQKEINAKDIPKGTSIIAQEFSPGRPAPTPINEVRQSTTDIDQDELKLSCPEADESSEQESSKAEATRREGISALGLVELKAEQAAMQAAATLSREVKNGQVEIETKGAKIVIRVKEKGSFPSGSATLRPSFIPIMARIREVLVEIKGIYTVEGHSDNVPIKTARFRSNWELSSSRAVSVAHELMIGEYLDERRFSVMGYGDTRPLVPNDNPENRSRNRRVEIVVEQGKEPDSPEFEVYKSEKVDEVIDLIRDSGVPPTFDFEESELF